MVEKPTELHGERLARRERRSGARVEQRGDPGEDDRQRDPCLPCARCSALRLRLVRGAHGVSAYAPLAVDRSPKWLEALEAHGSAA